MAMAEGECIADRPQCVYQCPCSQHGYMAVLAQVGGAAIPISGEAAYRGAELCHGEEEERKEKSGSLS